MRGIGRLAALAGALAAVGASTIDLAGRAAAEPSRQVGAEELAARIELGRRLFHDPAVSRTGRVSCASCHVPEHGFSDPVHPSVDEFGPAARRSMPLTDLPEGPLHSDGEFATMRDLLDARLRAFEELPLPRRVATFEGFGFNVDRYGQVPAARPALVPVETRVAEEGFYAAAFREAFRDDEPPLDRVIVALETYVRSLRTAPNPLDRYLDGDPEALTPAARRGYELFEGKARCGTCHPTRPVNGRSPLRDGAFHDTGIAWRAARADGKRRARPHADPGLGAHSTRAAGRRRNHMRFKTPSLRDVARRPPYMHDGSLATLLDVVEHYDGGGARHAGLDRAIRPLGLTRDEKDDLVAFLFALSGDEPPGSYPAPAWLGRTTVARLVLPDGAPLVDAQVEVVATGGRFAGVSTPAERFTARTDERGNLEFPFPPTTHARFRVAGHRLAGDRPLPDLAGDVELIAVPNSQIALQVLLSDDARFPQDIRAAPMQVVDDVGRVTVDRQGETIEFEFVRRLTPNQALYVAPAPRAKPGSVRRLLVPRRARGGAQAGQTDLDLAGGGLTFVDLRPEHHVQRELRERK